MPMVYVEWCRFHTPRAARDEGGYLGVRASVLWANYTSTMTDEGRSAATRVAARVSSKATAAGHGLDSRPSLTSSQDNAECRNATAVEFVSLSRLPGRRWPLEGIPPLVNRKITAERLCSFQARRKERKGPSVFISDLKMHA